MRRRRLLAGVGTALGVAVAGCSGSGATSDRPTEADGTDGETGTGTAGDAITTEPATEETTADATTGETTATTNRTITVERRVGAGGFNAPNTLRIEDDGSVEWEVACTRHRGDVVRTDLDADRHRQLERAVLAADPPSLAESYGPDPDPEDDTAVAVTDVPPVEVTIRVGGQETSVRYVTRNATPQRLNRLLELLDRIQRGLAEPDCPTSPSGTEVSATLRVAGGLTPTPWHREVTAEGDGTLRFSHRCPNSDAETTATGSISDEEVAKLRQRLLALDFDELDEEYTCEKACPTDLPGRTLTLRVGDRRKEIYFYVPDPDSVPETLRALHGQLSAYADRFEADCGDETTEDESEAVIRP